MVRDRVARKLLVRLHRGVYAVGHRRLTPHAHALAAVLAVGNGAVLSHRDAAWLHGLRPSTRRTIDVTTPRRGAVAAGIAVHTTDVLTDEDVTVVDGIPATSVARTLVDLAYVVPRDHLAKALREAEVREVADLPSIEAAMRRVCRRRGGGHARLRSVLAEHRERGIAITRSDLEQRFLAIVDDAGFPRPRTNTYVLGCEVDAVWAQERVAVELDSWRYHRDRHTFQRDREKGNALVAAGWRLLRFTYHDLTRHPERTATILTSAMQTPPPAGP